MARKVLEDEKMKKAQSLSLNTIVVAAIVLIVLLIIIGILTGTSGKVIPFFGKQTDCTGRGGHCATEAESCDAKLYGLKPCSEDKDKPVCCIPQQS